MSGIVVKLDGVTLTAPAWLVKPAGDLDLGSAADGSGTTGSLLIDDKDGTRRIRGWQLVEVDEPACTLANNGIADATRTFTGYAGRRTYFRGPYKDGPGRYILVELLDLNILLTTRLITGGDAVRPAETDTARLAWLIGSDYLDGLVQDLGLVNGTGLLFDANNTHGQYPMQVLQDLTSTYDQLFFVYYSQSDAAAGLFFDFPNATTNTSPLSISNDLDDIDEDTVWPPHLDTSLDADPAEVWSNMRGVWSGGVSYLTRQATADEFFTDNGLLRRGTQVDYPKIGKAATALTFMGRFLAAASQERLAITCTVRLPATHVNLLDSGMRVLVKATHLPDYGFDDLTYMRVQNRQVTQLDALSTQAGDLDRWYDVKVSLALTGLSTVGSGGGGGGGTGGVPHQPPSGARYVQRISRGDQLMTGFVTPTAGHLMTWFMASRGASPAAPPATTGSWTNHVGVIVDNEFSIPQQIYGNLYSKIATGSETPDIVLGSTGFDFIEWDDGVTFDTFVSRSNVAPTTAVNCGGTITPGAAHAYVIGCAAIGQFGSSNSGNYHMTPGGGVAQIATDGSTTGIIYNSSANPPAAWMGDVADVSAPMSVTGTLGGTLGGDGTHDNWAGITFSVVGGSSSSVEPPQHGQFEPTDTLTPDPDGVTTVFNTTSGNGYAAESMRIEMNGVDLERGVDYTESDNVAGEVTFTDPPPTGANVNIWYQGN